MIAYNLCLYTQRLRIIILSIMKENQIKLNQIVTEKQIRQKKRGSLHALNNSFKRNTLINSESANKHESCYQCKLPEVNFSRRDLSIILRYLLYKQEMQLSDRNLLRRILVSIFDEELISAGTKKFVNFLKLAQGYGDLEINEQEDSQFYLVLKGKGVIRSGEFSYPVKQGDTFGYVQILSEERINSIEFQSRYLIVKLQKRYFNEFFKNYFQKIYIEKQAQLQCVKENFLDKIPLLNKYLFLNKLEYRLFASGEKIVSEGEPLKYLYFLSNNANIDSIPYRCVGLWELLKQRRMVRQTIYCNEKIILPMVEIDTFNDYVLSMTSSFLMNESSIFDRLKINNRSSVQVPQRIVNFMNIKKVKLKINRSRLKTETNQFYETSFKFFKPPHSISRNPESILRQSRPATKNRYERLKTQTYSKQLRNNFI